MDGGDHGVPLHIVLLCMSHVRVTIQRWKGTSMISSSGKHICITHEQVTPPNDTQHECSVLILETKDFITTAL